VKVGIFHTAFLGDIALASLLIEALYREKHEVFLITKKMASLLYKEDYRLKGCIIADKKKGIEKVKSIYNIAKQIDALNLDVLLVPHKSYTTALISLLTKVPKKVAYNDTSFKMPFTHFQEFKKDLHECLRCLYIAPDWLVNKETMLQVEKIARPILISNNKLDLFLSKNPNYFNESIPFFIVSPGSVWPTKKYPAVQFAKAIFLILNKNKNIKCIVSGTIDDQKDINEIFNFFSPFPELAIRIIDTSSYLPLNEFMTLVSKSAFVIANDSSPIHIASGFNIPVVAIFGPTTWKFGFFPTSEKSVTLTYKDQYGNNLSCHPCSPHGSKECPKKHFRCMRELSPDLLVESVEKIVPQFFE